MSLSRVGAASAVTAAKTKKGRPEATLSRFWWRRRELRLRLARQTSALLRPPAPYRRGFSYLAGQTKRPPVGWPFCLLVEAAGVELAR